MADPQILIGLRSKRDELESLIAAYEQKLQAARFDLLHVNATLRIVQHGGVDGVTLRVDISRLFRQGEIFKICCQALAERCELDTRELALTVCRAKELDEKDAVLRQAVARKIVVTLGMRWRRLQIEDAGRRNGVRIWRLPAPKN